MAIVKIKFKETATLEDVVFLLNDMGIAVDSAKIDLETYKKRENMIVEEMEQPKKIITPGG